ncbi:hypothetical protein SH668x_003752 [Planctomicrobium sp. SH668]|uniref:hypothetical protein n=1 Tax=Planctomicrobium sp. SH668 TaxID=3448126 RepID=UPI003F5B411E
MSDSKELSPSEKMRTALNHEHRESKVRPLLAVLVGVVTTLLLISCCLCGIAAWWFRPSLSENPDLAKSLTREIINIEIPEVFQPQGAIEWNLAFLVRLRGAYYQRYVGDGVLTLLEVSTRFSTDETIRRHIRKTMLEEASGGTELIVDPQQTHQEIFKVGNQQVIFTFEVAKENSQVFHLVEGVVTGKRGDVLVCLRVDHLHWKNELDFATGDSGASSQVVPVWVRKMIESINLEPHEEFEERLDPAVKFPQAPALPLAN